ncbi:MAG: response regulator transcription factor [Candidatus Omnitrophota bacterium]
MTEKSTLRILVVDDEKPIRQFLKITLSSSGYNVFEAVTAREALEKSVSVHPDAIVLDLGLGDMDGINVIKNIRKHSKVPIVILSVRENVSDKISALDAGADDYLTKPFSNQELLARLRAVVRRLLSQDKEQIICVGKLCVDVTRHSVTINSNKVDLTPTEYDILKLLVLNSGKVLTHTQILRQIWNKSENFEGILHLLRVTISNLRSKIEPNPDRPTYILTEPGIGYRLRSED